MGWFFNFPKSDTFIIESPCSERILVTPIQSGCESPVFYGVRGDRTVFPPSRVVGHSKLTSRITQKTYDWRLQSEAAKRYNPALGPSDGHLCLRWKCNLVSGHPSTGQNTLSETNNCFRMRMRPAHFSGAQPKRLVDILCQTSHAIGGNANHRISGRCSAVLITD